MAALAGRRALVTGGGRGIGRQIALDLAREGAAVAVGARTVRQLDEVAAAVVALGGRALAVELDVSRLDSVRAAVARVASELGGVDVLVNGAGVAPSAPLVKTSDEDWGRAIGTNLSGCFYTMRAALPGMIERGWGRVVNVASIAGKTGYPYTAAYAASKHGLIGLTRTAALEVAAAGVTVNAVCPGYVDTPMTDDAVERIARKTGAEPGAIRRRLEEMSPQRRLVTSEEVSALVLFLCGEPARGITGQALSVDGGTVVAQPWRASTPVITREGAAAELYATEMAQRVADRAFQLHGESGVLLGTAVERLYREVRALRIYEGASEIQKLILARALLHDDTGGPDMGRVADLLSAVAAAAEEGGEGLELRPEDRALLLEGWSEADIDDALSLVQDSLMLGELVEAADTLTGRLMALLSAFADAEAFQRARSDGGRVPLEVIAHLARNLDWLDQVLSVYRDDPGPDRAGFEALRRRLADSGIETEMSVDPGGDTDASD